jgi:cytochrome o ubiquinol oxidase subunit 2
MNKRNQIVILFLVLGAVLVAAAVYGIHHPPALLSPRGVVAARERRLMITATLLMLIVVIPVYVLTFLIVWRYHESNRHVRYEPDWDGDRRLEFTWWAVPTIIIAILAVVTWNSSHSLDPFKSLDASRPALKIQVVALQWKWLFIYPQQNIASLNFVQFPKDTPVEFNITADAPMNSFWIPQLGGQIYAMSGMSTKLNLQATSYGSFDGSSANISGRGFSSMKFVAKSSSDADFQSWVTSVKKSSDKLSLAAYDDLSHPSENSQVISYAAADPELYNKVLLKFMHGHSTANYDLASGILGVAAEGAH